MHENKRQKYDLNAYEQGLSPGTDTKRTALSPINSKSIE
jgi:hypothetical protein